MIKKPPSQLTKDRPSVRKGPLKRMEVRSTAPDVPAWLWSSGQETWNPPTGLTTARSSAQASPSSATSGPLRHERVRPSLTNGLSSPRRRSFVAQSLFALTLLAGGGAPAEVAAIAAVVGIAEGIDAARTGTARVGRRASVQTTELADRSRAAAWRTAACAVHAGLAGWADHLTETAVQRIRKQVRAARLAAADAGAAVLCSAPAVGGTLTETVNATPQDAQAERRASRLAGTRVGWLHALAEIADPAGADPAALSAVGWILRDLDATARTAVTLRRRPFKLRGPLSGTEVARLALDRGCTAQNLAVVIG